jgi:formate hydrogenlyase subunit 3/multisubunit Na+/H+ antiporter MnhD subunit
MNAAVTSNGSNAKRLMVLILAILGVLAIIAGILYLAGSANSLHFMVGSSHKGHHQVRAAVSFVIGLALLAAAWFTNRATAGR